MIGILAEKPSQARNFATALGGNTGVYNGEQYIIVASHGHLYGFDDNPGNQVDKALQEKYTDWSVANLPWNERDFKWKYTKKDPKDKTPDDINRVLSGCDEICIATDDDPTGEGELLAWEIISELRIKAPKYTRMYFEDEAEVSIQKAFKERKILGNNLNCMYDDPDYKQALFRTKWDYLSMQWTRIATRTNNQKGQVLRNGRLKSAMVKIVGDQLKAVAEYVKKPYFQNRFKDENGIIYTSDDEPKFEKKSDVPNKYSAATVVCDSKMMKKTAPPKFIDLASLSAALAPMGINAKTCLATYQTMYQNKVVSYPRTEDHYITLEQFKALLPRIENIAQVVGVDPKLLTHRSPRKTHIRSGMAHGANRPGPNVPRSLEELDGKYGRGAKEIYTILARNYLATMCEDYEYEQQKGHLKEYPSFTGVSNVPKKLGWKAVYNEEEEDVSGENGLGTIAKPYVYEGSNPKPSAPTMKWLMKQLEKRNVGTGATRTSIYADVTNAKSAYPLLIEKKGKLSFAPCGEANYKLLPNTHIGDLSLTEHVMEEMKQVADGDLDEEDALHEMQQMIIDDIKTIQANAKAAGIRIGSGYVTKPKYTGVWAKTGKQISFNRVWGTHNFTDEECEQLLAGQMIHFNYNGNVLYGKLESQEQNGHKYIGFEMDKDASWKHPTPKAKVTGKWKVTGEEVSFNRKWMAHTFTDQEAQDLLDGKQISFEQNGKYFTGCLAKQEWRGESFIGFKKS